MLQEEEEGGGGDVSSWDPALNLLPGDGGARSVTLPPPPITGHRQQFQGALPLLWSH